MTRPDNSHHLVAAATARHELVVGRARDAIDALSRSGAALTVATVARTAGVSRGWLYGQPDLREAITTLAGRPGTPAVPPSERPTSASLRERLDGLKAEIAQLRAENEVLRDQLARRLGEERTRR